MSLKRTAPVFRPTPDECPGPGGRAPTALAQNAKVSPKSRSKRVSSVPAQRDFAKAREIDRPFEAPELSIPLNNQNLHELRLTTGQFQSPGAGKSIRACRKPSNCCATTSGPSARRSVSGRGRPSVFMSGTSSTAIRTRTRTRSPECPKARSSMGSARPTCTPTACTSAPTEPRTTSFRSIEPTEDKTFTYQIPSDHPAGTFWYHPHKHGSVAYQVSNGVAGH